MPEDLRPVLRIAAAIASRDDDRLEAALLGAREADSRTVEEAILQSHLFVGFPDALNALARWRRLSPAPAEEDGQAEPETDIRRRGETVCRTVYGGNYERLRANVRDLHPDLESWMLEHGYGRVIGRGGPSLAERELINVALLAVWRVPRQLHSHLRGALNAGAAVAEVEMALEVAADAMSLGDADEVQALWRQVRPPVTTQAASG
jgi:4-carboxymuconolactone decarboxylase